MFVENAWQKLTAQPAWHSQPNVNIMPLINITFIALGKGFQGWSSQMPILERTIFIFLSAIRGSGAGTRQFREGEVQGNKVWRFPPRVCFSSAFWERWNLRWRGEGSRGDTVSVIISLSWYVIRQKRKEKWSSHRIWPLRQLFWVIVYMAEEKGEKNKNIKKNQTK